MEYRVEDKYFITYDMMEYLRVRLKEVMDPDEHSADGTYLIRSIYFDDFKDSCLDENEAGVSKREKFRIRTYNNDPSFIRLELKKKENGRCAKESVAIDRETVLKILKRENRIDQDSPFLMKKFWTQQRTGLLRPVNIVEYERSAFVEPNGNVRITFDQNIGTGTDTGLFFERQIGAIPILPMGMHILEVKYDEFLPDTIRDVLNIGSLQRIAYSKYYYSRRESI